MADVIFGYLVLHIKMKTDRYRKFFNAGHPNASIVSFIEGSIKSGQLLEPAECDSSKPVEEGHFYIGASVPETPFILNAPFKKLAIFSFLTGAITNSKYVNRITDIAEPAEELMSPAKLLLRINNIPTVVTASTPVEAAAPADDAVVPEDDSARSNYTRLIQQRVLPALDGEWEGTILYHSSKPSFVLYSSKKNTQMHLVYFDGVYALIWCNSKEYLDQLWDFIEETNFNNRIYKSRNILEGKNLLVIHPVYAISKFKRAYSSSSKYSELILALQIMEKYISKCAV